MGNKSLIPTEKIDRAILIIRGHKIMLDSDLAEIYGVKTSRLNEQVKRNKNRFPNDFMFQLTNQEKQEVIANCDHLQKLKFSHKELEKKLKELERKYDENFSIIFEALRQLIRQ
ncbi:MAG: ORF6N domain-containing protein [Bacteroidetes bacterium]|nr:ORF6N domain-containing protein [Bacteroidota bacterium]